MADEIGRRKTAGDVEKEFDKWLKNRYVDPKTKKEKKLKSTSGDNYISGLKSGYEAFRTEFGEYKSVYAIDDPSEIRRILEVTNAIMKRAKTANEKPPMDVNTYKNFGTGMRTYSKFLDGEGPHPRSHEGGRYGGMTYAAWVAAGRQPIIDEGDDPPGEENPGEENPGGDEVENRRNLIFFGAPGTGKSYLLNLKKNNLFKIYEGESIRVTFHPDYSYAHFVGTYKPVPYGKNNKEITYKYVSGPFIETYVAAKENPDKKYVLVIEEINRANVAAVFGDVFQLLDRKNDESEYPVKASKDIRDYLVNNLHWDKKGIEYNEIKIPGNMYIWATMNSADQGVFPMDTAFKRRWDFEYLGIDTGANEDIIQGSVPIGKGGKLVKWNFVRQFINDRLAALGINEDKQLGAFFINAEIIANASDNDKGTKAFKNTFKNKVLMYLFEDAAKHKRDKMFVVDRGKALRYSEICEKFDNDGMFVFQNYADPPEDGGEQGEGRENTDSTVAQTEPSGEQNQ